MFLLRSITMEKRIFNVEPGMAGSKSWDSLRSRPKRRVWGGRQGMLLEPKLQESGSETMLRSRRPHI